ncbi:hypothetical protein FO519_008631 [Halicephalobus sp. NKZ332]|nr:hypothetical protein FO519_008631 [Halicephalobus sp. NKZ332]
MLQRLPALIFFFYLSKSTVTADTFYTRSGYVLESNCTGDDREAALRCMIYADYERIETASLANQSCSYIKTSLECFSNISNSECFAPDVFAQYWDFRPTDPKWMDLLANINMCGNETEEDLADIGCLFWKPLYYSKYCGMIELDDCEKRLASIQCRMRYVQSSCNTATAMKVCENYILEGGSCVDTVVQCRKMTFNDDKGLLTRGFHDYIDSFYDYSRQQIYTDYEEFMNNFNEQPNSDYSTTPSDNNGEQTDDNGNEGCLYLQRLQSCLDDFERRQEVPIWYFPSFFSGSPMLPTDFNTLSKYCVAIEELMSCFGGNFTENCINGTSDDPMEALIGYDSDFQFTLLGERSLCPNDQNGVEIQALSCLLNITTYIDWNSYTCSNTTNSTYDSQQEIMLCKMLAVDERCGTNMSKAFCQLLKSDYVGSYLGWSDFEYSCDSYVGYECQCSKASNNTQTNPLT